MKILESNSKRMYGQTHLGTEDNDESLSKKKKPNKVVLMIRNYVEVPLFGAAVFAILILGEINLFSTQVRYETEPIANIGTFTPLRL